MIVILETTSLIHLVFQSPPFDYDNTSKVFNYSLLQVHLEFVQGQVGYEDQAKHAWEICGENGGGWEW